MIAERSRTVGGAMLALVGATVTALSLYDVFQDHLVQNDPLHLTVLENVVPLGLSVLVFGVGVAVAGGWWDRAGDGTAVAKWGLIGTAGVVVVAAWTYGFQQLQGQIKPGFLLAYVVVWGTVAGVLIGVYDAGQTDRKRELAAQRADLAHHDRAHTVFRDLIQDLVPAESREEIEATTCEAVVSGLPFRDVWIGGRSFGDDGVEPRCRVSDDAAPVMGDEPGIDAAAAAIETGDLQESNRDSDGKVVAVPLQYGGTTYGALTVETRRSRDIRPIERTTLTDLGEIVGYAVHATKTRHAMTADEAIEVEFEVPATDCPIAAASAEIDGRITQGGMVSTDGSMLGVFAVEDGDPAPLVAADRHDTVEAAEVIREDEDPLVELRFAETSFHDISAGYGGVVREVVAEGGVAWLRVEVPRDTAVRNVAEAIRAEYPSAELVARRDLDRADPRDDRRPPQADELLTERQTTALKMALLSGYYESPRGRTGEEIAASLGVSGPTFHKHLRVGHRKLVSTHLDIQRSGAETVV